MDHVDRTRRALGIRQPWCELILRGIKTIEVRSLKTNVRGPIYIYSSQKFDPKQPARIALQETGLPESHFPLGALVGSVEIVDCRPCQPEDVDESRIPETLMQNKYAWVLMNPVRFQKPVPVDYLPYGVWFYPFMRKNTSTST